MGYIDNLLRGRKVEWKTLGEVFDIRNGYTPSKKNKDYWTDGTIPWFRMEDLRLNGGILDDALQHITPQAIRGKGLFKANSIIMATTATIGEHALLIADSLANQRFTNFSIRKSLSDTLLPKFVYYYFFVLDEWCKQNVKIGNFPSVEVDRLKKQPFPLPPLDVQVEIARILDRFTALEAALEAELEARQKQYEYYRDRLLSAEGIRTMYGEAVKPIALGDLGTFTRGTSIQKKDFIPNGGVGCIHYGQIYTLYGLFTHETKSFVSQKLAQKARKAHKGDLVIATTSENDEDLCKAVAWLGNEEIAVSSDACFYTHSMNPKYVSYYFQSDVFQTQKRQYITGTKVRRVNPSDLAKITIPLPSLHVQEEIVRILDKFSTLTTSLTAGLPREIALRRRQYEYYREQLLSFE